MQTVFFSKILKTYRKLRWYLWRSSNNFRNGGFSRDKRQPKACKYRK